MKQTWILTAVVCVAALACTARSELFLDVGTGDGGASSATTDQVASSGQGASGQVASSGQGAAPTTTATGGTSSTGGGPAQASSVGQGGSTMMCAHDKCDEGVALMSGCEPCVTQVCAADPFCCTQSWDLLCTYLVQSECNFDCAPNLVTCQSQYGGHPAVATVCAQSGTACDFNANVQAQSCRAICESLGGECINAVNNNGQCGHGAQYGCDATGFSSVICTCSRGCGGGPPCGSLQTCVMGSCI